MGHGLLPDTRTAKHRIHPGITATTPSHAHNKKDNLYSPDRYGCYFSRTLRMVLSDKMETAPRTIASSADPNSLWDAPHLDAKPRNNKRASFDTRT
jgi:hypothetical protein